MDFLDGLKSLLNLGTAQLVGNAQIQINGKNIKFSSPGIVVSGSSKLEVNSRGRIVIDGVELDHDLHIDVNVPGGSVEIVHADEVLIRDHAKAIKVEMGSVSVGGGVEGNVNVQQGSVEVKGNVGGYASTQMGNVSIGGSCAGDASAQMGNVTIGKK